MKLEHRVDTEDGIRLAASVYRPRQPDACTRAAIVASAVGVTRARYAAFARFLSRSGWTVVTFDYRGIGGSRVPPPRNDRITMQEWGERDLAAVIDWCRDELGAERLVAVAHSIGGQVAALAPNGHLLDALVAVGVQKGYWRLWSGHRSLTVLLFFSHFVALNVKLFGRLPLGIAGLESLPPKVALDWARWGRHDDYLDAAHRSLRHRFALFKAPILALSFADDRLYAPKPAVDKLFADYYCNSPCLRCHVEPGRYGLRRIGHSGFFDEGLAPRLWWEEVADWIGAPRPPSLRRAGDERPASLWLSLSGTSGPAWSGTPEP